jgi:hypothetical protein
LLTEEGVQETLVPHLSAQVVYVRALPHRVFVIQREVLRVWGDGRVGRALRVCGMS